MLKIYKKKYIADEFLKLGSSSKRCRFTCPHPRNDYSKF